MDDELSAARRRGAVRKLIWPHGKRHKGFMHGRRWMGVAAVLLICALTVTGIAVLNGGGKAPQSAEEAKGNEGALALSDFFKTYEDHIDFQTAGTVRKLTQRLMSEPFEVSANLTVESEALKALGIPLTSLPAQLDMKYDLRDAGVKVSAAGFDIFKAYLTENELTAASMGGETTVTELPAEGELANDMTLGNRFGAFVPLPSKDLTDKLLSVLAKSVPKENTEQQLGRAYSPKDKQDVSMTLVHTELDDEALSIAAAAFAEQLGQDEALYDETQEFITAIAAMAGVKDEMLDSLLAELINKDYEGITVSWNVYRRDEIPVGFSVRVVTRDAQADLIRLAEFDGETSYERTQVLVDGVEVFCADAVTTDDSGEFSVIQGAGEPVSMQGTFELEKITENAYHLTAEADMTGKLLGDDEDAAHVKADARIDVGSGLGMLKASSGWQDIKE